MEDRYIAFDVETPNPRNDRISAIGIAVVEGGRVRDAFCSLVDPQVPFHPFHMALTGITPERVAGAPDFPALWREIRPLLESGVLAAHNAPFDLSVLSRCLRDYAIPWRARVPYVCTCQLSSRLLPQLPNHRLDTLCRCLGLELDHHRAGSDSRACGEILLRCLEAGVPMASFLRVYDLERIRTAPRPRR